jgi:hypothetical protein
VAVGGSDVSVADGGALGVNVGSLRRLITGRGEGLEVGVGGRVAVGATAVWVGVGTAVAVSVGIKRANFVGRAERAICVGSGVAVGAGAHAANNSKKNGAATKRMRGKRTAFFVWLCGE